MAGSQSRRWYSPTYFTNGYSEIIVKPSGEDLNGFEPDADASMLVVYGCKFAVRGNETRLKSKA